MGLASRSEEGIRWKTLFIEVFLQVTLIVIGVMAGLMANEMREKNALAREADLALEHIAREVTYNQARVVDVLDHHTALSDTLRIMAFGPARSESLTLIDIFSIAPRGFGAVLTQTSAWEMALETGAVAHMDYEIARDLATLYDLQAFHQEKMDRVSDNIYLASNMSPENAEGFLTAIAILMGDITIQEEKLKRQYEAILPRLPTVEDE